MLYLVLSYRYAYVAALMCLIAIEVAHDALLAIGGVRIMNHK